MAGLLLTSGFNFEGYKITRYIGFFSGECALGTGFLSSVNAGLADFLGSNSSMYEQKLSKAKSMALSELKELARGNGANAIIGLDVSYTAFSADVIGVIAKGTAVRIEKSADADSLYSNTKDTVGGNEKYLCFPIINYYEKVSFRPFALSFDVLTNEVKISINNYREEKLSALNVDILANTVFGTVYEYPDINFVNLIVNKGTVETEKVFLDISNNHLKVIESITLRINHYVLGGKAYSLNDLYQISGIKADKLVKLRDLYGEDVMNDFHDDVSQWTCMCGYKNNANTNKCYICKRTKNEYTKSQIRKKVMLSDLMPEFERLKSCQEIYTYLTDIAQKDSLEDFDFMEEILGEAKKMISLERTYGNMKDSFISTCNRYISEHEQDKSD